MPNIQILPHQTQQGKCFAETRRASRQHEIDWLLHFPKCHFQKVKKSKGDFAHMKFQSFDGLFLGIHSQ